MGKFKQTPAGKGSLKDIQLLVNKNACYINNLIKSKFTQLENSEIDWRSPLEDDDFTEYSDDDFIERIKLKPKAVNLKGFWPSGGPHWDALAITDNEDIILVEAKANIPEMVSNPTGAKSVSKVKIHESLQSVKDFLKINNNIDWTGTFYQYTNRIAHLYYLREKCNKKAYLINIFFLNDETVNGPKTIVEWESALQVLYTYLGIKRHILSKYMANIYIDVKGMAT